jgi:signal transduction histidine kinase
MPKSIGWKLFLAFVLVATVGVIIVAVAANRTTSREFHAFMRGQESAQGQQTQSGPGGPGMMQGSGPGGATAQGEAEDRFLDRVNRSLWIAVGVALGLGAILSLLLSRQLVRPLRALRDTARRIAAGDLSQRVAHTSSDEVGEVADAFNAMADELARAQAQRRQVIADIAHELRTPIAVIDGTVSGILDEVLPSSSENLGSLKEETALLMRLVTDLRDLSLAEAGELKLELSDTNVGQLVEGAVAQMTPLAKAKGVALRADVGADLPVVRADRARLGQVIGNLLDNALRHTASGGTVGVSARLGDGTVVVSVADNGEGIAEADLSHVFERFYRADKSRSRARGGSGLGLAIVKELVKAHGGRAWAESTVGEGSVFSFTLPAAAVGSSDSWKKRASAG